MHSQFRRGRIFGIRIGIHYSWFVTALLLVSSLASEYREMRPDWKPELIAVLTAGTAIFFFLSIILHELAHSVVARLRGIRVEEITLFALGGVSGLERNPNDAGSELLISAAGPLCSFLLAGVFLWLSDQSHRYMKPLELMFAWLSVVNMGLALFNLVPAFPMDGGRVLRSLAWAITSNVRRATRLATNLSRLIASVFIAAGVVQVFRGVAFGGLWMILLGFYLMQAAVLGYREVLKAPDNTLPAQLSPSQM